MRETVRDEELSEPGQFRTELERARRRANDELLRFRLIDFLYIPIALIASFGAAWGILKLRHPYGLVVGIALLPAILVALRILRDPAWGVYLLYFIDIFRPQDQLRFLYVFKPTLLVLAYICIIFLLRVTTTRSLKLVWTRQTTAFALFFAVMTQSVVTGWNRYYAYGVWQGMVPIFLTFFFCTNLINTRRKLTLLARSILAFCLILCVRGIYAYRGGGSVAFSHIASGHLGDENDFALALIVVIPFAIYGLILWRGRFRKLFAGVSLFLLLLGVVLTNSRGGFVGLIGVLGYCWWKGRRRVPLLAGFVVVIGLLLPLAPRSFWREMGTITHTDEGTADERIKSWQAGLLAFIHNPVVGVGIGNSGWAMLEYFPSDTRNTRWGRAMHGTGPQLIAEMGTLGILSYLFFLIAVWRGLPWGRDNPRLTAAEARECDYLTMSVRGSIVGYWVTATFLSTLYYPHFYTLAAVATLTSIHYSPDATPAGERNRGAERRG